MFVNSLTGFKVNAKDVLPKEKEQIGKGAECIITAPSGAKTRAVCEENQKDVYDLFFTPKEEGIYFYAWIFL